MATIRKRGDLQWQAIVRKKGWPNQSKSFMTKVEAERWARAVETEMDRGIFVSRYEAESTTLYEALERYAREVTIHKKGQVRELNRIDNLKQTKLATRALANLRSSDFAKFRDQKRAEGKAENTIRIELALVSHLFNTARREWNMEGLDNPIQAIKMPSGSTERTRRLVDDEEARLMKELSLCKNGFILPAFVFAIETACRQGEILKLTWEDLDLQKKVAKLENTKNGENRFVPLSPKALDVLANLPRLINGGKVFQVSADGLSRAFARTCKKLDIEDLRFHDLRHEATSRLFEAGLNPIEVSSITGHKSLQMLKRYTHLSAAGLAQKLGWD